MLHHMVLGAVITGLNGIGLWHSVPLTGFGPSNGLLWRSFSTLEVAGSYYGLRYVKPFVFPDDDATLKEDLLLQHSIHAQEFETARLALQHSSKAASSNSNTTRVTTASNGPRATGRSTSVYLTGSPPKTHFEDGRPGKTHPFLWALFLLGLYGINLSAIKMIYAIKKQPSYTDLEEGLNQVTEEIGWFRREFSVLIPNLHEMGAAFEEASQNIEGLYRDTTLLINGLGDKTTGSMDSVDSQLAEIRKQNTEMIQICSCVAEIPQQFSWLNSLIEKTQRDEQEGRRISTQMGDYMIGANSPGTGRRFSSEPLSPGTLPDPPRIRSVPPRPSSKASTSTSSNPHPTPSESQAGPTTSQLTPPHSQAGSSVSGSPSLKPRTTLPNSQAASSASESISSNPLLTHPDSHESAPSEPTPQASKVTFSASKPGPSHQQMNWNTRPSPSK
jgi:hypothetical protein